MAVVVPALLGLPAVGAGRDWFDDYSDGLLAWNAGRYQEAIGFLEKAVERRPKPGANVPTYGTNDIDYYPFYYLGVAYLKLGQKDMALENLVASEQYGELSDRSELVAARRKEIQSLSRVPVVKVPTTSSGSPRGTEGPRGVREADPARPEEEIQDGMGTTWAVLIANNEYVHWNDLGGEPYRDVQRVENVLERYAFDRVIRKADLTISGFHDYLRALLQDMKAADVKSLLLYYAGHGHYDELLDKGYWVPVDAQVNSPAGYLADDDIRAFLRAFNRQARHVLLVSDSCFSGTLLPPPRGGVPSPADLSNLRIDVSKSSAFVITSGRREEKVQNASVFARAFEDVLQRNGLEFLRAEDVAFSLKKAVRERLGSQEPQYGDVGSSFGKFVFIRKR
jgi:tetratricopeptide (TPR) repeat protein